MKKMVVLICAGLLLTSCLTPDSETRSGREKPPESSASAKKIVDDRLNIILTPPKVEVKNEIIQGFTKGLNLGNGLDAPSLGEWGVVLDESRFRHIREAGFDHIRLPVRFGAHALESPPYTIREGFFEMVDWVLDEAEKNRLCVLIDLHHYDELMTDPVNHAARFKGLWKQIAGRYKDRPDTVAFELLNEPSDNLEGELLDLLMKETLALVRENNPTRLVFVDCYHWSNTQWLDKMDVSYFDRNTVATFHMYQPILFTHQGAPWMPPEYQTARVIFPGPPAKPVEIRGAAVSEQWAGEWLRRYNTLDAADNPSGPKTIWEEFDRATAFVDKTGYRVYMGEFGAFDFADDRSRTIYLKLVRRESERRGIGWAYWADGDHNRLDGNFLFDSE